MAEAKYKISDYLSKQEIQFLRKPNNAKAYLMLFKNYLMAFLLFALVAWLPNIFTVLLAVIFLGGVQMAMAAFLHDCSHRAMFTSVKANDVLGHWFGGMPLLVPMGFYRPYHFTHHTKTGTELDPDVDNIKNYPVSKASLARKILRDVSGLSGIKAILGILLYVLTGRIGNAGAMGIKKGQVSKKQILKTTVINYRDVFIFHGLLVALLYAFGHVELYGLWWAAIIFSQPFIFRVRQIAEHAALPSLTAKDSRLNTRTTLPTWWQKLLFAPSFINYHLEHHVCATVPPYHLPALHEMLMARGFYDGYERSLVKGGYMDVLKVAVSK